MSAGHLDPSALLAVIVDSCDDAIIAVGLDGVITFWNQAAERIFGYFASEAVGQSIRLIIPPARYGEEQLILGRLLTERTPFRCEAVRLRRDQTIVPVLLAVSPVCGPDGEIIGASAFVSDLGERRQTERDLIRLAAIVESSDDAIISKDLAGTIQSWNRGAERIFGYTEREAIGQSITMVIPADRLEEELSVMARIRRGQPIEHFETVRKRKDGRFIDISLTVSPIRTAAGPVIGASKIARDITEQKRLSRQLEHATRLKDEFLATLSHELRTPLNAILGYTRILRGAVVDAPQRDRALEIIERNARTLAQHVSDVLDVSGMVTGRVRLDARPCDMPAVVDAAIESLRPTFDAKRIRLTRRIERDAGPVYGDPERLQQVLWNLLTNAVKFTPAGGEITVGLSRMAADVELVVSDTGIGIDAAFLPRLFDRFSQADSRSTREFGGLGLGLALVRHFVELHGGTVCAESAGREAGATFRVRLPVMDPERPVAATAARSAFNGHEVDRATLRLSGVTVLAVDDDLDSLRFVQDALHGAGASVVMAASADSALTLLETTRPDVILADIAMPRMDGHEFIALVRARDRAHTTTIPAAALTAAARPEDRARSLLAGFQAHLAKPIDPSELVTAVATLLRPR